MDAQKRLTINAYTATGAATIVRRQTRAMGVRITDVQVTLRPWVDWVDDTLAAAYETTDHPGQKNATYDVTFRVVR